MILLGLIITGGLDLLFEVISILKSKHRKLKDIKRILMIKDFFSLAIIVLMHIYRLSDAGKVCSGDYL
jgi:hypothetical protein